MAILNKILHTLVQASSSKDSEIQYETNTINTVIIPNKPLIAISQSPAFTSIITNEKIEYKTNSKKRKIQSAGNILVAMLICLF